MSANYFQEQDPFLLHEQDYESLNNGIEGGSLDNPLLSVIGSNDITGAQFITDHHCIVADIVLQNTPNIDLTTDVSDYEVTFGPGGSTHSSDENDTEPYYFEGMLQQQSPSTSLLSRDGSQQQSPSTSLLSKHGSPQQSPSTSLLSRDGSPQQPPSTSRPPKIVTIHHGNCLNEMVNEFLDPAVLTQSLIIKRLLPNNTEENGTGSGVVRDVYSFFWQEFYDCCTVGTTVKVPLIRHDFSSDTWKAIGRILLKGYETCQYLPIKLSLPLMEQVLYGAVKGDLLETFMQFVSCQDHEIL